MKTVWVMAAMLGMVFPAGAGLSFQTSPYELEAMVPPHIAEIAVVNSDAGITGSAFFIGLAPDGRYELLDVLVAPGWRFVDHGYTFSNDGVHWWELSEESPTVISPPSLTLLIMTMDFPQAVSSFDLFLLDQDGILLERRYFVVAPEPGTLCLLGAATLIAARRRKTGLY